MPNPVRTIQVRELLRKAFIKINAMAENEPLDPNMFADGLDTLKDFLEGMSTDTLKVYGSSNQDFATVANQQDYTIGISGNWNTDRPLSIDGATCVYQSVSHPMKIDSQFEWDQIPIKSEGNSIPERLLYIAEFPLGRISLFPKPTDVSTISLRMRRLLTVPETLDDFITMPPGYYRAILFGVCVDLWPEYPNKITDIQSIKKIATEAMADIQSVNGGDVISSFDDVPGVSSGRE